jgi:tetratricopeptide (TPR) repeat protein
MLALFFLLLITQDPSFEQYLAAQKALAENPKSEQKVVALANILVEKGQTERVIALLEPFVKTNPAASRATLVLASEYVAQEKYDIALSMATQVSTKLPNDYYGHQVLGLALVGLNRIDEAEKHFKRTTVLKPDFSDAHFQLGLVYSRNPDAMQQAEASFRRALELGHSKPEVYKNLASINIKSGRYAEAIQQLNSAISSNPNYADAYFLLADALRKSGKADEAATAIARFQNLNAGIADKRARSNKSQAAYEEGMSLLFAKDMSFQPRNFPRAYEAFTRAATELPELDAAYYRLAQMDFLRKDVSRGTGHIRQALKLNPYEPEYYFVLASCLENSDLPNAVEAAKKAAALNPSVADFQNLLGSLLEKSGDYPHAVQSYRRATELDPADPVFKRNLAAALKKVP